ncbi:MAG: DNA-3-methyladenine glycosylase I [Gammaproteobacteria bacterium]|nr:MAG: DNA-3-methyladenine glycosylase I [Gammaproteobacteria bacterium]
MTGKRCPWCGDDPLYVQYHDSQWGRPVLDDRELFEKLCLDGQQAGLSWITILRKQSGYRSAFHQFDPERIARMTEAEEAALMQDAGIVRNRLKIRSVVQNARGYLALQEQGYSFRDWLWRFVDGQVIVNQWTCMQDVPTETAESRAMSKALKKAGFSFVGPTICYAFMQAVGMVNDHLVTCSAHQACVDDALRLGVLR